jgi:hypothetical protein
MRQTSALQSPQESEQGSALLSQSPPRKWRRKRTEQITKFVSEENRYRMRRAAKSKALIDRATSLSGNFVSNLFVHSGSTTTESTACWPCNQPVVSAGIRPMAFQLSCVHFSVSTAGERKPPNNFAFRRHAHRSLQSVAEFTAEITDGAQRNAQSTAQERRKNAKMEIKKKKLAKRRKAAKCFELTALPSRDSVPQKLVPSYLSRL